MRFHTLAALALTLPLACAAQLQKPVPTYFSVPPVDAPALAARGTHGVGVRTLQLTNKDQVDILGFDAKTGKAPRYDRKLAVEVWYPATIPAGTEETTTYVSAMPGAGAVAPGALKTFEIAGKALRDAAPVAGVRFPLVIVSHGYPGSRLFLTWLTENLASKGYVVAAIDHTDSVFGEVRGFQSTLLNRSRDQLFTIQALSEVAFLRDITDFANAAVVGYSMGGYGALTTAGAGLSKASGLNRFVAGGYLDELSADSAKFQGMDRRAVKAIVAIAPWGRQPPNSAWDAQGLAGIRVPSLFIAGDHDDVADFDNGIRPAFEQAVNSDRYLLVYENARHNTGGNPPPPGVALSYGLKQSFDEPVWRKDRITAINQHFITAFLDLHLKGDRSRREYLDVPILESGDGKWKPVPGVPDDGYSTGKDAEGNLFWKGFQRRSALGLRMVHREAGK